MGAAEFGTAQIYSKFANTVISIFNHSIEKWRGFDRIRKNTFFAHKFIVAADTLIVV
jgi:hypothetical protein